MDEALRVEHAVSAISYRIFADTPFYEALDLMIRRGLHAVPVVGEEYEVLGIITTGDALDALLKGGPRSDGAIGGADLVAREVMTRTVLCVSEDQLLMEAAQMMANRDVEQLPVVRDGALIGFLTRDSLLRVLRSGAESLQDNEPNEGTP